MIRGLRTLAVTAVLMGTIPGVTFAQAAAFSDQDKSFLKEITEGNLAEIKFAELALTKSKNADVRMFANKMVTDHRAMLTGSKPVAAKAGVILPTSASATAEAEYLKLEVLSGESFDKSYVKAMVSDHHEDMDVVKKEHESTQNASMKQLTGHAETVVGSHMKMIDGIAAKMGVS